MPSYKNLLPGDPAPWFQARATSRPDLPSTLPPVATSSCASSAQPQTREAAPPWALLLP